MSRSFLFIPGDVPRMLQQLEVFDADSVIIDFEDSVATSQKDEARHLTEAFLSKHTFKTPTLYIRINPVDSAEFTRDIEAIKNLPIEGVLLPKASLKALQKMTETPIKKVIALIETPESFFELKAIADHSLVEGLLLGAEDLSEALECQRSHQGHEILFARSHVVMAAKSARKIAIDTPFTEIYNEEALKSDASTAKQLGFNAKASIHPSHVDIINSIFSPSTEEIRDARRIVEYADKHQSMRFSLDGKMIDRPIIERAKKLIARAKHYDLH